MILGHYCRQISALIYRRLISNQKKTKRANSTLFHEDMHTGDSIKIFKLRCSNFFAQFRFQLHSFSFIIFDANLTSALRHETRMNKWIRNYTTGYIVNIGFGTGL